MTRDSGSIFVDRERETRRLRGAILSGRGLMITGGRDMGKTALVRKAIAELPPAVGQRCVYIGAFKDLQDLLRRLIRALHQAGAHELRRELRRAGVTKTGLEARLKDFSSSRLRGMLYRTVQGKEYRLFLDHCPGLTPAVARVIRELFWMRQMPVYVVTSAATETTKAARYFYWDEKQMLRLGPLPSSAARRLMEDCIQKFGLAGLELAGFRKEILELSQLIPGAIVAMCEMAADPRYQSDSRVKTKLIHIDYLMRGRAGRVNAARTVRRR
ncbi:MAG: hypothetical protein P8Z30_03070 [Acidobacteriota bacterium]